MSDPGARTGEDGSDPAVEMMSRDRASAALGIEVLEVRQGYARLSMTIDDRMINGHGIAHGGYVFLLADSAFACACNSGRPTTVAATAEIDYLAPAHVGDLLIAEAQERIRQGRSGITDITVRREAPDPAVIAEFRGRSRTLRRGGEVS